MSSELNIISHPIKIDIIKQEQLIAKENQDLMQDTYYKFNSIKYSTEELNIFKDNILSLLKERDKIFLNKLYEYKSSLEKINTEFNSQNKLSNTKFSKIIDTQAKITLRLDQLSDYENFVNKTNEKLVSHEVRLTNIRSDFSLATQKYDKIYLDNLEVPGYIGRCAKYKNCQVFFLDVIKDLAKLNIYREKNIIDLKMYKDKLETIISSMNSILDNNNESQMKYIKEMKEKILKDCKTMFESVTDNMKEIRVENSKYSVDLIKTSMDLSKKWEKLEKIKEELLEKFNYDVNKYQMLTDDTIKSFEEFKNEYGIIRHKFMELAEFIKDVRFRKNIGGNVKKKEVKQMVKKMLKKRKSFEGENVRLLSDINNIESIDYKKYYNVDNNEEGENSDNNNDNNNNNRSKSLKQKNNKKNNNNINTNNNKEKLIEKNKMKNKNNSNSTSKEVSKPKKEMNQSVEENFNKKININKITIIEKDSDKNKNKNKSSRSVTMNINISSSLMSKHNNNNNKKNNSTNNNMNIINPDEKNVKNNLIIDSKNLKEEENYEQKGTLPHKLNKNKDTNIIKLVKNNVNNNLELRNILDDKKEKEIKEIKEIEPLNINNTENIIIKNNKPNNNTDSKPSLMDDTSAISEVRSSINKENKFSSERNESFISDTNSNNINKFIINDINLEQNDKIIKELASELEQSTAKKDKLESKLKSACNNIEPINLLFKKNENKIIEIGNNSNNNNINNNNENPTNINEKKELNKKNISTKIIEYNNNINNINDNLNNKKEKEIINKLSVNIANNSSDNDNNTNNINNTNINKSTNNQEIDKKEPEPILIKQNSEINNDINNIKGNNNININDMNNSNLIKNESISNLNPIKINNEIHLNEVISSNSVNKKLHAFDQKLLNLELYTKEKIIELISQINSLKQNNNNNINNINNNYKLPEKNNNIINNSNIEPINKLSLVKTITPSSNEKYKTFNNSFMNNQNKNQNQKLTQQNYFSIEKIYENEQQINNNENNKNLLNISNNQNQQNSNIFFNNLEKKRYPLRNINTKQALINSKVQRKNSVSYNLNSNKKFQNNVLTENNSINSGVNTNNCFYNMNNILKNNNNVNNITTKDIIEGVGTKLLHNLNNDINAKFLKDTEKKMENNNILKVSNIDDLYNKKNNNKSINYVQSRNNYGENSFIGTEIKLVDLNKLVNHQLPRNRLLPIHIND